ncbi:MAG: helix-turn-helix domain-containing protein [Desulfatibacillum sp.]|nr:helix-turn-helix domain-containing protein [Desulfatibacillum sp.]
MASPDNPTICRVKQYRQEAGLSQAQLAELAGVKRQAIYDIESNRYLPNTGVALRLARHLGCLVEDLFSEGQEMEEQVLILEERGPAACSRVSLARVRGRLIGYPLDGEYALNHELRAADGITTPGTGRVRLLHTDPVMENTVLLMGCDPAFSLLAAHVSRKDPKARILCRFASSQASLDALAAGQTHLAGTHFHSSPGEDSNVLAAREKLSGAGGMVVGFSMMEEGFMVARGNPLGIRSAGDLASKGVRLVNREEGAALRVLLDDELSGKGIPTSAVAGYDHIVRSHSQGAQMVACNVADAALGLAPIAHAFGLDFVPIVEVRCDLVIPADIKEHPAIRCMLDAIQSRNLREEISLLRGYHPGQTGNIIAQF